MDNVPDATLEQSEALDVSPEVLPTSLKANRAVDNNVLTEPSDDMAVVPDVSEYSLFEKPDQVTETEAAAETVEAKLIDDFIEADTYSRDVKDEGTKSADAPFPSKATSAVASTTEVVDDGRDADILVQTDSADDTRVPDIINVIFDQRTEHEVAEVISSTLKEATAIPAEGGDAETKSSSVDNNQVMEHNPSETINEEKAIFNGTVVENIAKEQKPSKHPAQLIDTSSDEPMFLLTPPTPHTHTPTFITPPDPDDEVPPPSSDIVTDLVNSLLYPGHTPSGVIHLMDFAFFALFATLVGMLMLTGGNLHVVAMLVLSLGVFGSIKWFIIELEKVNEEVAALKTKKDN
ncbi:hypothetical protein BC937DRAFT_86782 [Endogone sp. FLAS-F59071]|nr:hypothetical protein BC937DRAFT_86782 [Endogone sp. FLAS-F59071]|eukprot:RUS19877.1 hypothetical protein BC937DRAFT_86782 [Endogone sp. FLAS-F59071]